MPSEYHDASTELPTNALKLLATSPGVAVGPIYIYNSTRRSLEKTHITPEQVEGEQLRLSTALAFARNELQALSEKIAHTTSSDEAAIFEAQQLMLSDPDLLDAMQELIVQQYLSAAYVIQHVAEQQAQELETLESNVVAARASDVRDAFARAVHFLTGETHSVALQDSTVPILLVAYDLTPSDTAHLNPQHVLGICTVVGGGTTHAAILARALEIPAVAGLDPHMLSTLHDEQYIAIDGTKGLLYPSLSAEQQRHFSSVMEQQREARTTRRLQQDQYWRHRPGVTADGYAVSLFANVGDVETAQKASERGAQGIGLLRTEFLFGGRAVFPNEQEQFEGYLQLFRAFRDASPLGDTIVARTLDAGADKPFPALEPLIGSLHEANPALGLRGARIHLVHEELFRQQIHALLRAGTEAAIHLHIMFPMIATVEEVRRLKTLYHAVRKELIEEGITLRTETHVGIMIETPAAAIMADVLAREVDFFSIGANDLFQYTMAVDRTNNRVSALFGTLEPALWRFIAHIARVGNEHGKTVALCGELASDPRIGPLLVGLGVTELSMSPHAIPGVKAALAEHTIAHWQQQAALLLQAETSAEMQSLI